MYYIPEPPYFLLLASLLISLVCGAAFAEVLKQSAQEWSKNRSTRSLANLQGLPTQLPFFGVATGSCVFLASGLGIFGFPPSLAYAIALPLTVLISLLVWSQLRKILVQLERGGSQALDLDSIN